MVYKQISKIALKKSNKMKLIHKIILSILWRTGLGKLIGSLFWKRISRGPGIQTLYRNKVEVFKSMPIDFEDKSLNEFLKTQTQKWNFQEEFVVLLKNVLVEPDRLLGIQNFNKLIEQTVVYKHDYQYPYILPYLFTRKKIINLEQAVLYDGSASRNYYHHLVDAVSSLQVLKNINLPVNIPYLITRKMFDMNFFQLLYNKSSDFRNINWKIIEPNEWVRVKNLYKAQAIHYGKETWEHIKILYKTVDDKPYRKIFLSRDKKIYSRSLTNESAIENLLLKYGFEKIYAEHIPIEEQAKLFASTKYLVALTGMGLVQQFFMNNYEAHIIELMPSNRKMPEYYWLAYALDIKYYDILVGTNMNKQGNYEINPAVLEKMIIKMLANIEKNMVYGNAIFDPLKNPSLEN